MKYEKPSEVEQELKRMKPRKASDLLKERIFLEMENTPLQTGQEPKGRRAFSSPWRVAALFLVAVTLGAVAWRQLQPSAGGPDVVQEVPVEADPPDLYMPVLAGTEITGQEDEGVVYLEGNKPYRRIRYDLMDHYEWQNSRRGSSYRMSKPREHIVLVGLNVN